MRIRTRRRTPALGLAAVSLLAAPLVARAPEPRGPDEDLAAVEARLEWSPEDPAVLVEAAEAAAAADDPDRAMWYATLAEDALTGDRSERDIEERILELRGEAELPETDLSDVLGEYSKDVFQLAKACASRRLYANAADILMQCEGTRFEREAREQLEKLFRRQRAIEALLESGVPVEVEKRERLSPEAIAKLDAEHDHWENAYEAKGEFYTVKTDMGYEMAHAILDAMEQMNGFYRKVFGYKERGGSMRRCEVRVWKSREEFDAFNPGTSPGVKGFFRPLENSVSTYDPRTEGGNIESLWSTLFHEASHQFTRAVWKVQIPTWLNEGTASYFEGAAILPGGVVDTNRIPDNRLRGVVAQLGSMGLEDGRAHSDDDRLKLKDVVTYFRPGSYPGAYYPYGWGLVYFCMNYEDEDSERVYRPVYEGFMDSYTGGGRHDVFDRFVEHFVREAEVEGVETFEDFEELWARWMRRLAELHFGGPEKADDLIARGRVQVGNEKYEYAVESFRWALRKRPDDPTALLELGRALEELDRDDAALYAYRQLVQVARRAPERDEPLKGFEGTAGEALEAALEGVRRVNRAVADNMTEADETFVTEALAAADAYVDAGLPRSSVYLLENAGRVIAGDGRLMARADELRDEYEIDIRLWRRIESDNDLTLWSTSTDGWTGIENGLRYGGRRLSYATLREAPPRHYRFETRVRFVEKPDLPALGIAFAKTVTDEKHFLLLGSSLNPQVMEFGDEAKQIELADLRGGPRSKDEEFTLALEVTPDATICYCNGEELGKYEASSKTLRGSVGVFCQGGVVEFDQIRIQY